MTESSPPAQKTSSAPPSSKGVSANRNTLLLTLGGALALSVSASIHEIGDPLQRTVVALTGLVVVFMIGYFTMPSSKS